MAGLHLAVLEVGSLVGVRDAGKIYLEIERKEKRNYIGVLILLGNRVCL